MREDEALAVAIMKEPRDPLHCLAYADWADEQGSDQLAFALRWMARHGRRPFQRLRYRSGVSVPGKFSWGWFRGPMPPYSYIDCDPIPAETAYVPRCVFTAVSMARHRYYWGWGAAVEDLAKMLHTCRQDLDLGHLEEVARVNAMAYATLQRRCEDLQADVAALRGQVRGLCDRVAGQAELLARRAERPA